MKIFYTTTSDFDNAKSISKKFLTDKKAVCINLIKNVNSFYLDGGSINVANEIIEVILIIKTNLSKRRLKKY